MPPNENVAYAYDQSGHGFSIGRLLGVIDAAGALPCSYGERGNLTNEARMTATAPRLTSYSYGAHSRISSIFYPLLPLTTSTNP